VAVSVTAILVYGGVLIDSDWKANLVFLDGEVVGNVNGLDVVIERFFILNVDHDVVFAWQTMCWHKFTANVIRAARIGGPLDKNSANLRVESRSLVIGESFAGQATQFVAAERGFAETGSLRDVSQFFTLSKRVVDRLQHRNRRGAN
jgi:hypothetical protein